jgi:hypothetical protein
MQTNSPDQGPELVPFRDWLRTNGIGISTGYRLVSDGRLTLTHIGKRSYLTRQARAAFLESLNTAA